MTATPQQEEMKSLFVTKWEEIGKKAAKLAAGIPEEKFEYRPAEGVRTVGEVLRHLAFWDQYVADTLLGRQADDSTNEVPQSDYPTKAGMIEVLERNSRAVIAALQKLPGDPDRKTVELLVSFIEHTGEHYGQLVVYSRLLGIAPAA